jgi:tetraacyldisaccharide 4'-kinase
VILDDGFQNPTLTKDVSLVVVDGTYGLGNGRTLPAGPLRESVAFGMRRASAIVVVGGDAPPLASNGVPVLHAALLPTPKARGRLAGARVVAFAGIGRPAKFFAALESIGCTVVARCEFPDHHRYRPRELTRLRAEAHANHARLVTTTKDWMRLADRSGVDVLDVAIEFADTGALERVLTPALPR